MEKMEKAKPSYTYPGVDSVASRIVSRSLDNSNGESIGFGFMNKNGVSVDEKNFRCAKYALVYVIRGEGKYVDPSGNVHPLTPGCVFQRHPGALHSTYINPESGWSECFLDFGKELYEALSVYRVIKNDRFVYQIQPDETVERNIYALMSKLERCGESELPYIVADSIVFLSRLMKRCEAVILDDLDAFVDETCIHFTHSPEKRIDLKKYCAKHGVGYENFRKRFRLKVGISPMRYIINRRVDAACEKLRMSRDPVSEIAFSLGYASPYEFSAQFKKVMGISPKRYRR